MAIFEWRKFNFFDLRKGIDSDQVAQALQGAQIKATTSGNNLVVICDSEGMIHAFNRSWEPVSFRGHDGPILLCDISKQNNMLVTVGCDGPSFKVWNLGKLNPVTGAPCLRTVRTMEAMPTALAVSEGGQFMAIGFAKGGISLYRGDISRDRSKTLKQLTAGSTDITGIAFKHFNKLTQMFVCSDSGVYLYNLQSRDKEMRIILDTISKPVGCCALQTGHNEGHFMVGREDAVYCYTSDGRGPCYALEGKKTLLQWFRSHLLIVSRNSRSGGMNVGGFVLTVIDIQNKFIVFTCPIEEVAAIITEFGSCYILTENKAIFHLDEKDLQSKLNLLFKKNLYDIAVRIAKSNQYDADGLAGIFKQYGDHLYSKGDFSGSVDQYIKTIGFLEPSYVIRRFLDARHIHYLTDYLQAIHKSGRATADHTTLLLNCFTRLDRTEQLKQFLENENKLNLFDVDVAIKVCRNASVEQAMSLAKAHKKHDLCLSILTEDLGRYEEALEYIMQLEFHEAEKNVKKYGVLLMEHCPEKTIHLLKKLCTDYVREDLGSNALQDHFGDDILYRLDNENSNCTRGNPEDFIHLFSDDELLIDFLEHLIRNIPSCSKFVYNTLIEHYLYRWRESSTVEIKLLNLLKNDPERYDKNHVLIQCRVYQFWPGVMHLYEEDKLHHLIIRHYLKNSDYENLLVSCRKLGQNDASLWLLALNGLKNDQGAPPKLLSQVLQVIAQEKLQAPLQILNCLAVENGPTLLPVRDYFMQVFQKEQESTHHDLELTAKYSDESTAIKKHIKHLQEGNVEFRNTVCDTCKQPLSWPALFFLCKHSYHQDCIRGYSETERDCPVCNKKNMQLMDTLRAQSESRGQHEAFHNLLDRSSEPFSVVAEYFGRGLFNKLLIVEEETDTQHAEPSMPTSTESSMRQLTKQTEQIRIGTNVLPAKPQPSYGPGAEARIRQEEGQRSQARLDAQESEMRLRLMEQEQIRQRQQASLLAQQQLRLRDDRSPRRSPYGSPKPPSTLSNYTQQPVKQPSPVPPPTAANAMAATASNPFDEDDDMTGYDSAKNPFAADEPTPKKQAASSKADPGNPFEDYDSNLDPFAELFRLEDVVP
ncbi:AAEL003887-PA [Aedes aegypti]|uniref:Vacuolar protein sorting-associated protein 11 homolog n=3 Tax=Aedes aegypti TaxID=7159 RepID=Q17E86_AEDAE|nr:vacuolar protein sorting-associated protein 11 homolog [Aedes aegypti]EAT44793.1 AAEL003887-PA [Aedes aegypti]